MAKFPEDTALVKLNGTIIKHDGSSYRSRYFSFLDIGLSDYSDIAFTPEQAERIHNYLAHMSTGSTAAGVMICGGQAKCPIARVGRCPFVEEDTRARAIDPNIKLITPLGRSCPIEYNLVNEWTRYYVEEYNVSDSSFTEIQMCRELAEVEMLLSRINHQLADPDNASFIQEDNIAVDRQGNPLTKKSINTLFEIKEKLNNRKSRLTKLMVGDRQEKYKKEAALKQRETADPSSQTAQLRARLSKLLSEAKNIDLKIKENEGDLIDTTATVIEKKQEGCLSPEDLIRGSD